MHTHNRIEIIAAMFLAVAALGSAAEEQAKDRVSNPSFEEVTDDRPVGWRTQTWGGRAEFSLSEVAQTGGRSVSISSSQGADAGWRQVVPVRPFSTYRFSGWIKTENVEAPNADGALFNIHNLQGVKTPAVTGTKDWTLVEMVFDTAENDSLQFNCLFGGWGSATGRAWYDSVKLERLSSTEFDPAVTIDTSRTSEPISIYIYGQFIEHLGRCIYGGIWAEMLEDRKFYHAVGNEDSPWKAIGDGAVEMAEENVLAGEQSALVKVAPNKSAGIAQEDLGVVWHRDYVGRVVISGKDLADGRIEVSLVSGPDNRYRETMVLTQLDGDHLTFPLHFRARSSSDNARLEIVGHGTGSFQIGAVSLMPADNILGMRRDTLALLRELDAPIYRWPGGNFVSGYDWKDGIGPRDERPPRKNPAWRGVEHNDFGIDEFMTFCRVLGTEPLVVVNSGLGGVEMACEELQYANGSRDSEMGRIRTRYGNPEPYNVRWWGVGNEMYGNWQLGNMPLEDYVKKHNLFVEEMEKVDPSIRVVAVGNVGEWSRTMLANCAEHMDLMSEHFYVQERPGLISHVRQVPNNIRRIADAHRQYRRELDALEGRDIDIALDEWNYWYGPHVYGELGTRYFLKDGLGIAAGIHEIIRNADMYYMANYAQTVNVIGAIKTNKTDAAFATTGLALKLYRNRFGTIPVAIEGDTFPLDVSAAWTENRKTLTIGVVNPLRNEVSLPVDFAGDWKPAAGRHYLITGPDAMSYNEPGERPRVTIEESPIEKIGDTLVVPPLSISIFALEGE